MKDQSIRIRVDDEFLKKVEYLRVINDYTTTSSTIRKVIEKEFRKEMIKDERP